MPSSPDRRSSIARATLAHRKRSTGIRDLAPIFALIWLGSAVRLAVALVRGEAFGADLALVLLAFVLVPAVCLSLRLSAR